MEGEAHPDGHVRQTWNKPRTNIFRTRLAMFQYIERGA